MNLQLLDEDELFDGYVRELQRLEMEMVVYFGLGASDVMSLVAALQLALRHPGFQGPTREITERIVAFVRSEFSRYDAPYAQELIRRGGLSEFDGDTRKGI